MKQKRAIPFAHPPALPLSPLPSLTQALLVDLAAPGPDLAPAAPPASAPDAFTALAWGTIGADGPHPVSVCCVCVCACVWRERVCVACVHCGRRNPRRAHGEPTKNQDRPMLSVLTTTPLPTHRTAFSRAPWPTAPSRCGMARP